VLTLFSLPKPFVGGVGRIQHNALASWMQIGEGTEVIVVGDQEGIAEAAAESGAEHIPETARSDTGTPLLDDCFRWVDAIARHPLRAFVNADIVLLPDFLDAVRRVAVTESPFLLVGQSRDLDLELSELSDPVGLRERALREGRLRGPTAIDWFVFPAGLFDPLPPFMVGRATFDNWMIWRARQRGPVIDATRCVVAIHQPHDYSHLAQGKDEAYYGAEAQENLRLGGGKRHRYTLADASHLMTPTSTRRHLGSILRTRERLRKVRWKLAHR
jgi:hypothetical protein